MISDLVKGFGKEKILFRLSTYISTYYSRVIIHMKLLVSLFSELKCEKYLLRKNKKELTMHDDFKQEIESTFNKIVLCMYVEHNLKMLLYIKFSKVALSSFSCFMYDLIPTYNFIKVA